MTTSSIDDESLSALFRRAEAERAAIESSSPTSADYGTRVAEAMTLYERVQSGITSLSLFSRNEGIDDVSTSSLPLLSVEWRLAELEVARWEGVDRKDALRRARERYGLFLDLVDAYGLVVPPYHSLLERFRSRPGEFSVVDEGFGGRGLAAKRDAKIAAFKAEKELPGPLLSRTGKPLQPFTLVNSRADRSRAVFRPGHNLPTMSVDEYLAEERRRGGILDGGGGGGADDGGGKRGGGGGPDDDRGDEDVATYKARAWDDFKDDNPRGSGNTLNMG
ncbi:hypothetical protein CP532_5271 [Ophiocordyceps camponoti-leonardi (nom. inval.)]|nr:hypothetical protein CP532_5271 [Ophiocordyceps camponoti-leonardi (nom. inval.)]